MIQIRIQSHALTRMQGYLASCRHSILSSILADQNIGIKELAGLRICIVECKDDIISTTVDDILHFIPVEMHRRYLTGITHHNLLCIGFFIFGIMYITVTDGNQSKSQCIEMSLSIIRYIPTKCVVTNLIVLMTFFCPLFRSEAQIWRKCKFVLCQ